MAWAQSASVMGSRRRRAGWPASEHRPCPRVQSAIGPPLPQLAQRVSLTNRDKPDAPGRAAVPHVRRAPRHNAGCSFSPWRHAAGWKCRRALLFLEPDAKRRPSCRQPCHGRPCCRRQLGHHLGRPIIDPWRHTMLTGGRSGHGRDRRAVRLAHSGAHLAHRSCRPARGGAATRCASMLLERCAGGQRAKRAQPPAAAFRMTCDAPSLHAGGRSGGARADPPAPTRRAPRGDDAEAVLGPAVVLRQLCRPWSCWLGQGDAIGCRVVSALGTLGAVPGEADSALA